MTSTYDRLTQHLLKLDRFGYEVEMHYNGSSMYRTYFGSFITVLTYTLILINSLSIFGDFITNEN